MSVVCRFNITLRRQLLASEGVIIYLFIHLITPEVPTTFKQFSRKLLFVLFITSHKVARNAYAMETSGGKVHL